MRMLVLMLVSVIVSGMVMIVGVVVSMSVRRLGSADGGLLFGGFGSRFGGLLRLLFSDCQWVAFRVLSMGNCKPLV